MPTRRARGRRAAWLLSLLLVFASSGRAVCGCSGGEGHCAGGERAAQPAPSCHGHGDDAETLARGGPQGPSEPCAPGEDCCCFDAGTALAQAPEGPALDHHAALGLVAAPFALLLPPPARGRAGTVWLRPPRQHAPPLYVVNCSFRC